MTTNSVIALTPETLNALFPEGSAARIELQRASLTKAASQFVKHSLGDEAKAFLRDVIAEESKTQIQAINDELYKHFGSNATSQHGRFIFNQGIKDRIKDAVHVEVMTLVREEIDSAVAAELERLKGVAASAARNAVYNVLKSEVVRVAQQETDMRIAAIKDGLKNLDQE